MSIRPILLKRWLGVVFHLWPGIDWPFVCLCRIERSRTILPCLVSTVEKAGNRRVNWRYFYELLFTTANLRLVHIVCHDKASHERFSCDLSQVFVR